MSVKTMKTLEAKPGVGKAGILAIAVVLIPCLLITACGSPNRAPQKKDTLYAIDASNQQTLQADVFVKPKTDAEIRQTWEEYIRSAEKEEKSRQAALDRLAALELEAIDRELRETPDDEVTVDKPDAVQSVDSRYEARLTRTINLLSTALQDYPEAEGNDQTIYKLAGLYSQKGDHEQSTGMLRRLTREYPDSSFYPEAWFRLAEEAFSREDYISAEDGYTEVLASSLNENFHEKALFKRGWSRYKQQLYLEAVDDYLAAVDYHDFGDYPLLEESEKNQFDEYFRAIGLAFSNMGDAGLLRDYFSDQPDFEYRYRAYASVSDVYLQQERYSDAVNFLNQFIQHNSNSAYVPDSRLKIMEIWRESGFANRLYDAIDAFYNEYNPSSSWWKTTGAGNSPTGEAVAKALKEYVVLVAKHHHGKYQQSRNQKDFLNARLWYQRYLEHYLSYARQDNIYYLYAELLDQAGQHKQAIGYYELAARDGDIMLDKKSAYATIVVSDRLYANTVGPEKTGWLERHLQHAYAYSELYPNDERTAEIVVHAASLALTNKQYRRAVELAELLPNEVDDKTRYTVGLIRGQSYFHLQNYRDAEAVYSGLLIADTLSSAEKLKVQDNLALAVYRQAELAKNSNDSTAARRDFIRIAELAPDSEIAATGIHDAIALAIVEQRWEDAVSYGEIFKKRYPGNKLMRDVSKKLALAYSKSDQTVEAADEFRNIARIDSDRETQMAALLQAAELYEANGEWTQAILSYRKYANTFTSPFPQYMETMYKLTGLYGKTGDFQKAWFWQNKIRRVDRKVSKSDKTDRTRYIASSTILELAKERHKVFGRYRLVEPLRESLKKKKQIMQEAIKLYGQASANGIADITSEATHGIASIYRDFSAALLESERPQSLVLEEREQYDILIEDQAFAFEDKAIEFYETNLARTRDGLYNDWIEQSYQDLLELFPVRYGRSGKADNFVGTLD